MDKILMNSTNYRGLSMLTRLNCIMRKKNIIHIHPLFAIMILLAIPSGFVIQALMLFGIVLLHEFGHVIVAKKYGYEIDKITLLPFGGMAELKDQSIGFHPRRESSIAIAGPAVNILLIPIGYIFTRSPLFSSYWNSFFLINFWIFMFNMLPALPLDGGRIIRAIRAREIGYEHATREAYQMAIILSVLLFCFSVITFVVGKPHLGAFMLAIFLFVGALTGRKKVRLETMQFLRNKHQNYPVTNSITSLAVSASASVRDAALRCSPDRYMLFYVLGDTGEIMGMIDESEIATAVFRGDWMKSMEELLKELVR
ncbi:M50 family metallopeptidase [Alicyclobacillus tolerans]